MFVEIRDAGGKKKYYLVHSFRQGKKVKKVRRFLGTNLNKEKLPELQKIAEQQIIQRVNAFKKINDPLLGVLSEEETQPIKALQETKGFRIFHFSEK